MVDYTKNQRTTNEQIIWTTGYCAVKVAFRAISL